MFIDRDCFFTPGGIVKRYRTRADCSGRKSPPGFRRRGAFDFSVLSAVAAVKLMDDGTVEDARIVLGAVASKPIVSGDAAGCLIGEKISDEVIEETGSVVMRVARPVDNTDLAPPWRKKVSPVFTSYALGELRGDDVTALRERVAHQAQA